VNVSLVDETESVRPVAATIRTPGAAGRKSEVVPVRDGSTTTPDGGFPITDEVDRSAWPVKAR
jgi:hypothetical protein